MSELLACRVCLATDVKLYNIQQCGLTQGFQTVIGYVFPVSDGLPQHLCCYCLPLLRKSLRFKSIYSEAQDILARMVMSNQLVTTESLRVVQRRHSRLRAHRPTRHRCAPHHTAYPADPTDTGGLCTDRADTGGVWKEEPVKSEPGWETMEAVKAEAEHDGDDGSADGAGSDDEPLSRVRGERRASAGVKQRRRGQAVEDLRAGPVVEELGAEPMVEELGAERGTRVEILNVDLVMLSKEEQIAEIQARRTSANYLSSPLQCQSCYKGFLNDTTYRNHMDLHDPSAGPHSCDVCQARFPTPRQLTRHVRAIHASRYICRLCRHTAHTSYQARLHQKWHEGVTYDCEVCGKSFSKVTTQLTHLRLAHARARDAHRCARCGEAFLSAHGLRAHVGRAHKPRERAGREQSPPPDAARHRTHTVSEQHGDGAPSEVARADTRTYSRAHGPARACKECGALCKDVRAYTAHFRRVHLPSASARGAPPAGKQKNYVCEHCGKKCTSLATLSYHQRVHSGEKPHACGRCPRAFRLTEQLQIHMRLHTGERPFACQTCPKAFAHKAALNRHVRVHTGAKPYACAHCGKTFSQSNSMKLHVNRVHLRLPQPRRRRHRHSE